MYIFNYYNSPYSGLHIVGSEGSLNGPVPILLLAATRNSYVFPSNKSVTVKSVCVTICLVALVHLPVSSSLFSIMELVIGLPPSDSGGDQWSPTFVLSILVISGLPGKAGTSATWSPTFVLSILVISGLPGKAGTSATEA